MQIHAVLVHLRDPLRFESKSQILAKISSKKIHVNAEIRGVMDQQRIGMLQLMEADLAHKHAVHLQLVGW